MLTDEVLLNMPASASHTGDVCHPWLTCVARNLSNSSCHEWQSIDFFSSFWRFQFHSFPVMCLNSSLTQAQPGDSTEGRHVERQSLKDSMHNTHLPQLADLAQSLKPVASNHCLLPITTDSQDTSTLVEWSQEHFQSLSKCRVSYGTNAGLAMLFHQKFFNV